MPNWLLTILAFAWPPVAAWLVLKLLPASISRFIEKEIERRSDAKLERIKAELQSAYSTLKTSVDVLSASSSAMHPHIVKAMSELWNTMLTLRDRFGGVTAFDMITLASEAKEIFEQGKHPQLLEYVKPFAGEMHQNQRFIDANNLNMDHNRLFCGDRIWLVFYIYRAVVLRSAMLISLSIKKSQFNDWRSDHGIEQLLSAVLSKEQIEKLRSSALGGLNGALALLENEFLHSATKVMSGSKAMSDSLADMQAVLLLQNAKIAERGPEKKA